MAIAEVRLILGPEIKSVTNNSPVLNGTLDQVDTPVIPLTNTHKIKKQLLSLINTSFNDLRPSKPGLDILDRLKKICSNNIQAQMDGRFVKILEKYTEEALAIEELYLEQKDNSLVLPHHSPVIGCILRDRSLFIRMKKLIISHRHQTTRTSRITTYKLPSSSISSTG